MNDAVNALRFRPLIPSAADDLIDDAGDDVNTSIEVSLTDNSPSYALLKAVVMATDQPLSRRIRCAIAALPYEVPKVAVSAGGLNKDFAAHLERARLRSAGGSAAPALIASPAPPDPDPSADPELGVAPQNSSDDR